MTCMKRPIGNLQSKTKTWSRTMTHQASFLRRQMTMDSRMIVSTFLIVFGLCMLTEKTHGSFVHFFSHSDVCHMQGGPCHKRVQQRSEEGDLRNVGGLEEDVLKIKAPVEIEVRLDSQQIENYQNDVEDMFRGEPQKS
ncbi:promotilin-like isoform X2 [Hyla sarda]|uniref:promotilin-like isoform X2 n=1 Tax=Hyla sarda TaxID=327740 RepID=UPI0024C3E6A7|nr:promotilin-like isoform X2 [Hyla sarda]